MHPGAMVNNARTGMPKCEGFTSALGAIFPILITPMLLGSVTWIFPILITPMSLVSVTWKFPILITPMSLVPVT